MTLTGYVYVCSAGETFDSVALELFGNEKYACELLNANPAYSNKIVFDGDEELEIPDIEMPETVTGEQYMPAKAPWKE